MTSKLLITIFAVVKYVAMPPNAVPNAIGISNLLGRIPALRAACIALGRSNAPTATLFISKDKHADEKVNTKIRRVTELAAAIASRWPSQSMTPLFVRV